MTLSILTVNNKGRRSNLESYQSDLIKRLKGYFLEALIHSSRFHGSIGDVGSEVILLLRKDDTQFYIWQQASEKHRFEWTSLNAPKQFKLEIEERDAADPILVEQVDRTVNACETEILPEMLKALNSSRKVLSVKAKLMFKNSQFTWASTEIERKFS